ncbi:glycine betaine ABC transporter substrate-binding protein [Miniphocaeibacter halophilus]|uniref:ABC transporter permease subunit n=1 Tax=Miniphocaeibacter halophilus TaxID=2931922 RepID=A0AC61N295_9FIRM|nr:glycine betaine ABC transporter substrate-binding protein [Miniphocaeibacter halophilus]QQK09004.1 ABC transporter permease subunit [Miniphocaeibacter halophilus]
MTRSDFYIELILEHLTISIIAILIAGLIGLIIGILISEYKGASEFVLMFINIIYTIPSISLLGLLIPFSGIGNKTAIIALIVYALLPMVRSTHTGITNIDDNIIEAARGMGSTDFQILYKIQLPLAFPVIMSGLRNMVIMTIALTGIASFIGAGGLGVAIYRGITTNNMAMTIAGSLLIAILAFVLDFILGRLEKYVNNRSRKKLVPVLAVLAIGIVTLVTLVAFPMKKEKIHVATKPMTEQQIMGEMLKYLIEDESNLEVDITHGVGGGTSNIQPAMEAGEFDIYPEYTGTGWNVVLKQDGIYDESMFEEMQKEYNDKFNMQWLGMYGFNNTFGLVVDKDIAEEHNIKTYSDLAKYTPDLVFGAEYDFFEREDGYDALSELYGFNFEKVVDIDIGLKHKAMEQKEINVMNIFTTDGQLSKANVVVLEDDKGFYPSYICGNVVRNEVLEKHPELKDIISKTDNLISEAEMANLNYLVESEGQDPKVVAKTFLEEKGLLK